MKPLIKRTLIVLVSAAALLGGLSACSHHSHHYGNWSEERVTEMRGKAVERISSKLELNADQKQKLNVLADELLAQRRALRGESNEPRAEFKALIAAEKFDRIKAQALIDQKTQAVREQGPKLVAAMADFYDSLTPAQQQKVRERLEGCCHGSWMRD